MCHTRRGRQARARSGRRTARTVTIWMTGLAFVGLAASVIAVVVALGVAISTISPVSAHGGGGSGGDLPQPKHITCGSEGLPACPPLPTMWISIKSETPGNIIAAARQATLFKVDRSGNGDYLKDLSHLGIPVFVHGLSAPTATMTLPDVFDIPIQDHGGNTVGVAILELNATHTAVHLMAINTYVSPPPQGSVIRMSRTTAIGRVSTHAHVALRANAQPELVYFQEDAQLQEQGKITWAGGGNDPGNPTWLIPGANGQDYVVGLDGNVHLKSELPFLNH